jgi:hypothetical protein
MFPSWHRRNNGSVYLKPSALICETASRARKILEDARPDVLITFTNDHFDRCFYDNLPAFLVGGGDEAVGPAVAGFDIPTVRLPIASKLRDLSSVRGSRVAWTSPFPRSWHWTTRKSRP